MARAAQADSEVAPYRRHQLRLDPIIDRTGALEVLPLHVCNAALVQPAFEQAARGKARHVMCHSAELSHPEPDEPLAATGHQRTTAKSTADLAIARHAQHLLRRYGPFAESQSMEQDRREHLAAGKATHRGHRWDATGGAEGAEQGQGRKRLWEEEYRSVLLG